MYLIKLYIIQTTFVHDEKYLSDVHHASSENITFHKYVYLRSIEYVLY